MAENSAKAQTPESMEGKIASHMNASVPIFVLSSETLREIFMHAAGFHEDPNVRDIPDMHKRTRISHVCKHWRSVALGFPALWSRFDVVDPPEWMAELLVRSKQIPLQVSISYLDLRKCPRDESVMLVLSSLGRIRDLSLESAPGFSEAILRLLDQDAPLLRTLSVDDYRTVLSPTGCYVAKKAMVYGGFVWEPVR